MNPVRLSRRQRHELSSQMYRGFRVERQPCLASLAVRPDHTAADEVAKGAVCAADLLTDVSGGPQNQRGTQKRALASTPRCLVNLTERNMQWPPDTGELILGSSSCEH